VDLLVAGAAEQNDRVTFGAGEIPAGADPLVQGSRDKMLPGEARHGPSAKGAAGFVHRDRFGNVSICGFSGSFPLDFVILSLPKKRLALRVEASA
jgi:hypothetical protein